MLNPSKRLGLSSPTVWPLGIVVFGVGLFFANVAAGTIRASGHAQAGLLATAARIGILVLSAAIALRQMGIAGGRDIAAKQIEEWRTSMKTS